MAEQNPNLDNLIKMIGEAGRRLSEIDASEGAAGNMSVCARWPLELGGVYSQVETLRLPMSVPELAGATFIVTGSGRRLREVIQNPAANLGCLVVDPGGETAKLYTSSQRLFTTLTGEFNSHLAVHYDQLLANGTNFHAVVHAQPPYLTYLSHIAAYQDETYLNRHLLRWQPETIMQLPEGMAPLRFLIPGSTELVVATVESLREHRITIWSQHGVMSRSDTSVQHACDLIEYAEAAARYEYLNLIAGEPSEGLKADNIRAICDSLNIQQNIF